MNAKNITEILDALAARFGATSAHLWAVLVRQQYVAALQSVFFAAIVALGWLLLYRWYARQIADDPHFTVGDDAFAWFPIVALIIAGIIAVIWLVMALPCAVNPEYYALADVLRMVGGK